MQRKPIRGPMLSRASPIDPDWEIAEMCPVHKMLTAGSQVVTKAG